MRQRLKSPEFSGIYFGFALVVYPDILVAMIIVGFILLSLGLSRYTIQSRAIPQKMKLLNNNDVIRSFELIENERARIAADLHDSLGNMISTARLLTDTIPEENSTIKDVKNILTSTHAEIRRISQNLFPKTLAQYGLNDAVFQLFHQIDKKSNMTASFHYSGQFVLNKSARSMVYRIVEELISNSINHANGTQIQGVFEYTTNGLNIRYCDDGKGLSEGDYLPYSISNRVNSLNGHYSFDMDCSGFAVEIQIPSRHYSTPVNEFDYEHC